MVSHTTLRHRDASGRRAEIDQENVAQEHFMRPSDGRLALLTVQASDETTASDEKPGWTSLGKMRLQVSPIIELVHWIYSSVMKEGSEERHYDTATVLKLSMKWIPSCIILLLMLIIPQDLEGTQKNGGYYDPIRYRDWGYPKASRNAAEDRQLDEDIEEQQETTSLLPSELEGDVELSYFPSHIQQSQQLPAEEGMDADFDDLPARQFRPRFLCFVTRDQTGNFTVETRLVDDWIQEHGPNAELDFIFLSYTRKQFIVTLEDDLEKWKIPGTDIPIDRPTRSAYAEVAKRDRRTLLRYGKEAALAAGKSAFWLDFECIRDHEGKAEANSQSDDVYRISDIVRAAHSLVILLGPHWQSRLYNSDGECFTADHQRAWFHEWGTRLWTLPEILLSSPEYRARIYTIGKPSPEWLAKRNFPSRAWKDAKLVRQLIDHYESSIRLTPLELVSIALECFASRGTDIYHAGDMSYALMGLLRRRPIVRKSDSGFEAFARLSLANDSDNLLERLLCMQPVGVNAPWYEIKDAWGVRLWDIEPRCQIAGIVDDGIVTLDGAFGATIQWDSMDQIAFFKRPTLGRILGKILLRGVPVYFIMGLSLTIAGSVLKNQFDETQDQATVGSASSAAESSALGILITGIIILIPSVIITLFTPAMLFDIYRGKFWSTQALFVGVEGHVDIGEAERHLFGFNHGRLKWSTNGSTLSQHRYEDGECVAVQPRTRTPPPGQRVFTLIDTYSMTATCFYAERPPTALIICGQEGGMQRAVLCSYDWKKQTFARETVVRVKTLILDRMFRVDRFRFAMKRKLSSEAASLQGTAREASALTSIKIESKPAGKLSWEMWKFDLILVPFMLFLNAVLVDDLNGGSIGFSASMTMALAVGFFVACLGCTPVFRRIQIGHILTVSILVLSGTQIGSTFTNPEDYHGIIALCVLKGISSAIILTSFIFLTGAWYTAKEQALRILTWGFCNFMLYDVILQIQILFSRDGFAAFAGQIFYTALCIICMGLAAVAYFWIKTPEQMRWISAQERTRLAKRKEKWKPEIPVKFSKTLRQPWIWCLFAISLLNSIYNSSINNIIAFRHTFKGIGNPKQDSEGYYILRADFPSVCIALLIGVTLFKQLNIRMLMIGITITLGFIGNIIFAVLLLNWGEFMVNEPIHKFIERKVNTSMAGGILFLAVVSRVARYLIWSISVSEIVEGTSRLFAITLTLAGYSMGGIIGAGFWIGTVGAGKQYQDLDAATINRYAYISMLIVFFLLQLLVLFLWWLYSRRENKRTFSKGEYSATWTMPPDPSNSSHRDALLSDDRVAPRLQRSRIFRFL